MMWYLRRKCRFSGHARRKNAHVGCLAFIESRSELIQRTGQRGFSTSSGQNATQKLFVPISNQLVFQVIGRGECAESSNEVCFLEPLLKICF